MMCIFIILTVLPSTTKNYLGESTPPQSVPLDCGGASSRDSLGACEQRLSIYNGGDLRDSTEPDPVRGMRGRGRRCCSAASARTSFARSA